MGEFNLNEFVNSSMMKLRFTAFNVTLSLVALFIISRAVTCIDTAMPYDGKMKTNIITIDSMRFTGELCDIIQHDDNNSYFFKSYGQFKVRDLDSLQGRSVVLTYLDRKGFGWGIFPRYRVCKLEVDSVRVFNHIMYRGTEYMTDRQVKSFKLKPEWIDEWGGGN